MTGPGSAGPYELDVVGPAAAVIAGKLPEAVASAVIEFITGPLIINPYRVGRELKRELAGTYCARRGTFRVLYRIDDERRTVTVVRVSHRAHVYRPLA
jgi:mRNA interferase RelE/StbE